MKRKELIERTKNWWYCDNIITHPEQVGLLHMGFPRVFILMRDYDVAYWASYEKWKEAATKGLSRLSQALQQRE